MPKKYPAYIKAKAIELRTERSMTLDDIVDRLKLPKTTIYGWIKDIPIPRPTLKQRRNAVEQKPRKLSTLKSVRMRINKD